MNCKNRLFPVECSGARNLAVAGKGGEGGGETCRFSIGPWFSIHFARHVITDPPKNATERTVVTWLQSFSPLTDSVREPVGDKVHSASDWLFRA